MRRKILTFSALLASLAVIATSVLITLASYHDLLSTVKREVIIQSDLVRRGLEFSGLDYLQAIEQHIGHRITLLHSDGTVIFDSIMPAESMDNHADRPEIEQAMASGSGEATRYSDTLGEQTFNYATRLSDGSVLRISSTIKNSLASFVNLLWLTIGIVVFVSLISLIIASRITKKIIRPINEIDLNCPDSTAVYDELAPLLLRLKRQRSRIQEQMQALDRQRIEFTSITENMNEGFLAVDKDAYILAYNASALRLLGSAAQDVTGKNVLVINRSKAFRKTVQQALTQGTPAELVLEIQGRYCQIIASSVMINDKVQGAIIFIIDITEKQEREQLRREFTANVSHELKTPLTSISGYAEIIMNGIAAAEDVHSFSVEIYSEAQRMIALVDDLLLLSQLDEHDSALPWEQIELLDLAAHSIARMQGQAAEYQVSLSLSGEQTQVQAVRSVIEEMLFNLLSNAIKYNRTGGTVDVHVSPGVGEAVLVVADSGIGIPLIEQERIFERFYRVDKSHHQAIPGTGLGLAIVKHGAALHQAKIDLQSSKNGTSITIRFPQQAEQVEA